MKKLKRPAIYGIFLALGTLLLVGIWYIDSSNQSLKKANEEDHTYVSRLFDEGVIEVVSTQNKIIKPYINTNIKALNSFYDYKADEETQKNSIINYETTYIQNTGISYGGIDETFDVVSVLPGTVSAVKEDKLMGKIVVIEHDDNITTTYQSLSEVTVKEGDIVAQSTVIGKAGESNLEKDLGKHVLFEITVNGKYVNPESCFEKTPQELKSN